MRERTLIGRGREHNVYLQSTDPHHVYKTPTIKASLVTYFENRVDVLRKELDWAHSFVKDSPVIIPPTRIFPYNNSYVMTQPYIREDNSVDKKQFFKERTNPSLSLYYELHPQNFISEQEKVYWIDPAKGFVTRAIGNVLGIPPERYWETKRKILSLIRR